MRNPRHPRGAARRSSFVLRTESLEARRVLTDVGGMLAVDTTWTVDESPYNVTDTIEVPVGLTLDIQPCLLYTSPSPRDATLSRMPSSA